MDRHILSMCSLNKKGNIRNIWFGYKYPDGPEMSLRLKDVSESDADMIAEEFTKFAEDIDRTLHKKRND
jgi:hypothetical protein